MENELYDLVLGRISRNGFSSSDIKPDTELLNAGYLDSLDVAEILHDLELKFGRISNFELDSNEEISLILFNRLISP
jgi:acyl carrier protein